MKEHPNYRGKLEGLLVWTQVDLFFIQYLQVIGLTDQLPNLLILFTLLENGLATVKKMAMWIFIQTLAWHLNLVVKVMNL